jgi:hypothetical protein
MVEREGLGDTDTAGLLWVFIKITQPHQGLQEMGTSSKRNSLGGEGSVCERTASWGCWQMDTKAGAAGLGGTGLVATEGHWPCPSEWELQKLLKELQKLMY